MSVCLVLDVRVPLKVLYFEISHENKFINEKFFSICCPYLKFAEDIANNSQQWFFFSSSYAGMCGFLNSIIECQVLIVGFSGITKVMKCRKIKRKMLVNMIVWLIVC